MHHPFLRFAAIPLFLGTVFFGYAHGLDLVSSVFDASLIKHFFSAMGLEQQTVLTLLLLGLIVPPLVFICLLSAAFSYVAAQIYGKQAVWVALLSAVPVAGVRVIDLFPLPDFNRFSSVVSFSLSVYEISSFTVLLCLGTYLRSKKLQANNHVGSSFPHNL